MPSRYELLRREVEERRRRFAKPDLPVTIALDVMGSENGPEEMLQGAYDAVVALPRVTVICVGPAKKLQRLIREKGLTHPGLKVENAMEVVDMLDKPHDSLRKTNSSIAIAAKLVKEGIAQGLVSPGNTGATMATCMVQWRRLHGISRPAIACILPHGRRRCLLLDVGANVDCKPRNLLHFAMMGSVFSQYMFHRTRPRVGLLSNGEEEIKGNQLVTESRELLKQTGLNFCGNAEGRDLFKGSFDVVVCDGFVGNAVLKFGEGLAEFIMTNLKDEVQRSVMAQLGALAMIPAFRSFKKQVDHTEYGGAPLLGLNGTCIICHGSAPARSILNAIRVAEEQVAMRINERILEMLQATSVEPV